MDLDDIKRGLRAEIKKRENEQYLTFQCNVRQMCKDVLAKLEEQESVIAELKAQKAQVEDDRAYWESKAHRERHHKYKRCLAMAMWCAAECVVNQNTNKAYLTHKSDFRTGHYWKWEKRWLELAEKFKEAK